MPPSNFTLFFFSILLISNINGQLFKREQVHEAARMAHIHDVIMSMPDQYDTKVFFFSLPFFF